MWNEKLIEKLTGPQIVNDSKTPSGRVHVGSLRGVLIHDAIYRALVSHGFDTSYSYGIDDFDPLDGLPADAEPWLKDYLGYPLCNVPAPEASSATDLADHYISEFLGIFSELGVGAEIYRTRDLYRCGRFNAAIDAILNNAHIVRKVYAEVSHAARASNWFPFQVICEQCGKIGATEVTDYDGKEVSYECKPDLVTWATGCGNRGKVSPFDGNGKLPWKLEWVAKWHTFGITIEGAGKDHCTKGGSREVAAACLRSIFGENPPLNVPYEFFLVGGAKMSSSKAVGTAAREMADLLPPEVLRFLMIRTPPRKAVNFSTDCDYLVKLYNEHDRLVESHLSGRATAEQEKTLQMIKVDPQSTAYHPVGFQLLTALLQLPHIDVEKEIKRRSTTGPSTLDKDSLHKRLRSARYWLEHFASEEDRLALQPKVPDSVNRLRESQRAFLSLLGSRFPRDRITEDEYQSFIFDMARLTPIDHRLAFQALYRALFDKDQGPKGGALLSYLDTDFLIERFSEVAYSVDGFWHETSVTPELCEGWISEHEQSISEMEFALLVNAVMSAGPSPDSGRSLSGRGVVEVYARLDNGREHTMRVLSIDFGGEGVDLAQEAKRLEKYGSGFIQGLAEKFRLSFKERAPIRITQEHMDTPMHHFPTQASSGES
ncbi:lysine--tRNA ligase [Candidatus Thiosymbion oneisti]|uniref:lysine--tRNA ligase n=1 Tax=Candidatus Thiosymbion oneisti TaxID=589554 RepID=UPI000A7DB0B2|nr:lysine--tRNA ligase [Candidatus Thiosymbion oneisti]